MTRKDGKKDTNKSEENTTKVLREEDRTNSRKTDIASSSYVAVTTTETSENDRASPNDSPAMTERKNAAKSSEYDQASVNVSPAMTKKKDTAKSSENDQESANVFPVMDEKKDIAESSENDLESANVFPVLAEKKGIFGAYTVKNSAGKSNQESSKDNGKRKLRMVADKHATQFQEKKVKSPEKLKMERTGRCNLGPVVLGAVALAGTEHEERRHGLAEELADNLELLQFLNLGLSQLVPFADELKPVKYNHMHKMNQSPSIEVKTPPHRSKSPSIEVKQKTILNTGDVNAKDSSKSKETLVCGNKNMVRASRTPFTEDVHISPRATADITRSPKNTQASTILTKSMVKKKQGQKYNLKTSSLFPPETLPDDTAENEKATSKDNDIFKPLIQEIESSGVKPQKRTSLQKFVETASQTDSLSRTGFEDNSNRRLFSVEDKSTQTDPLPKSENTSKDEDAKDNLSLNLNSNCAVVDEASASSLLVPDESNLQNVEIIHESRSDSNSLDQNLQRICEEFARSFNLTKKTFDEGFKKYFED